MTPTHEELARALKVEKLATAAERAGVTGEDLESAVDLQETWEILSELAGTTKRHSLRTRRSVVKELRRRAAAPKPTVDEVFDALEDRPRETRDLVERVRQDPRPRRSRR